MQRNAAQTIYLRDYKSPDYLIETVDLEVSLDEKLTEVKSRLTIKVNPENKEITKDLVLHGEKLELVSVSLDSKLLQYSEYQRTEHTLTIFNVPQNKIFTLDIKNYIKPQDNDDLLGLYLSKGNVVTQCETEGFRRITYFIDRPDVMSCYTVKLIADKKKYPTLLANGNLSGKGDLEGGKHWIKWEDPFKKPSYLFAVVAGDFDLIKDSYKTRTQRTIELQIYAEKGDVHKCHRAMGILKKSMRWDEENYGRECDLGVYKIVAISDFTADAQENKGLNIFNAKWIVTSPETTKDEDVAYMEAIIPHEYFHNWTGNRVTIRDWFQLSLKEGLTTFRDESYAEDVLTPASRIGVVDWLRNYQFVEDAGSLARPVQIDSYVEVTNVYTGTAYQKGAEIFRMIQTWLGKDVFRKGMDLYFHRYDGQAVTIELFMKAMEDAANCDLSKFLLWFRQAGTPILEVVEEYIPEKKEYILTFKQSYAHADKKPVPIPIRLALLDHHGQAIPLHTDGKKAENETVILFEKEQDKYHFSHVPVKPILSLLRGFSAPVKVKSEYKSHKKTLSEYEISVLNKYNADFSHRWNVGQREFEISSHEQKILDKHDLKVLFMYDSDLVNRWSAGQRYFCLHILDMIREYQKTTSANMFKNNDKQSRERIKMYRDEVTATVKSVLESKIDDLQTVTYMMTLPTEKYLVEQLGINDIDAVYKIRNYLCKSIAADLKHVLSGIYDNLSRTICGSHDDQFSSIEIGKRSLKNMCLGYLMRLNDPVFIEKARLQFEKSLKTNMTDTLAALRMLVNVDIKERDQALKKFYQQWGHDAHTMNYWFEAQAASELPDTLEKIELLLDHEAFDIRNPNKVRAILQSLGDNSICFHRVDGAGYVLFANIILQVDAINPEVAAKEIAPLLSWKYSDLKRQALMRSQLERIAVQAGISINLKEVITHSLREIAPVKQKKTDVIAKRSSQHEDDLSATLIKWAPTALLGAAAIAGLAYFISPRISAAVTRLMPDGNPPKPQ